ncbi:MAG: HAD-IA family hydrolase [Gammaproteobacteria bacterium]|nr:HAD-IA family hydrolase [Gammaproteobacteria bacterium]
MLKALVFDVDGTLADTEEIHRAAYNAAFVAHGMSWYWTHQRYAALLAISGGQERLRYAIRSQRMSHAERRRLLNLVPALHGTKTRFYREFVAAGRVHLRPGIARLIGEARAAGVELALVSSTTPANIDALLNANLGHDARGWFRVVTGGAEVAQRKPAPDIFKRALADLDQPAAHCVAFEDTAAGVAAAAAAGLFTVGLPNAWSAGHSLRGAQLVLGHLGEPEQPLAGAEAARVGGDYLQLLALARLQQAWLKRGLGGGSLAH